MSKASQLETVAKLFGNMPRLRTQQHFRHVVLKTVCTMLSLRTDSDVRVNAVGSRSLRGMRSGLVDGLNTNVMSILYLSDRNSDSFRHLRQATSPGGHIDEGAR